MGFIAIAHLLIVYAVILLDPEMASVWTGVTVVDGPSG